MRFRHSPRPSNRGSWSGRFLNAPHTSCCAHVAACNLRSHDAARLVRTQQFAHHRADDIRARIQSHIVQSDNAYSPIALHSIAQGRRLHIANRSLTSQSITHNTYRHRRHGHPPRPRTPTYTSAQIDRPQGRTRIIEIRTACAHARAQLLHSRRASVSTCHLVTCTEH